MLCLVDNRISENCLTALTESGIMTCPMPAADYLSVPVASHPDMLVFAFEDKLFCHARYYAKNADLIQRICESGNLSPVISNEPTGEKYPLDVLFNCVQLGNILLCNTKTVSGLILNEAERAGVNILHVNQGYTKCSLCKVSENAVITSDPSVAGACREHGIDVLTVSEGGVDLEGYGYGFIGGASGSIGERVFFCGDISLHPDSERIKNFCASHGKLPTSLSDEPLCDVGTLIFI